MERKWWKESVVYQIYPRSFMDSNGDGIGDLQGAVSKLDYLKDLGIDVIWLSPVYKSPNDDNGYDISDYQGIMDEFGTMEDWDELITEVHKRDMKLVMDLVVNHVSDEHPWFIEARKSKENPYRDYFIWQKGKEGKEPNNWVSFFSGSAWEYDQMSDEYFLHLFSKKQPDLNWENPKMRQSIYEMMTWWLERGVDGFRMDVINLLSKTEGLPDAPISTDSEYQWGGEHFCNGPKIMDYLTEMKEEVFDRYDIMTVGETNFVTTEDGVRYTNESSGVMDMLFQFEHMGIDKSKSGGSLGKWKINKDWKLTELKQIMSRWQNDLEGQGWNALYLENHDQPRSVSRFGDTANFHKESAKMLAAWIYLMQGTPFIYQGQEIGMTNVAFDSIDDYKDIEIINFYNDQMKNSDLSKEELMSAIHFRGRDNARTPMQWSNSRNAGFSSGLPWIKVNPNYKEINVEDELKDNDSILHFYKKLIQLRKEYLVSVYGSYELILKDDKNVYAYLRELEDERLLVISNFTKVSADFYLPEHLEFNNNKLLLSNYECDLEENLSSLKLRPFEARVYLLN
jgi:oligo-1,6-glucosidase